MILSNLRPVWPLAGAQFEISSLLENLKGLSFANVCDILAAKVLLSTPITVVGIGPNCQPSTI